MPGELILYILGALLLILLIAYICFYKQVILFIVSITGKKRIQKKLYKGCKINDLLIINDIYLPIGENKYKHIDTIIFGNKYIYITRQINQVGDVKVSLEDSKWRVINNNNLTIIDNPFLYNKKVINYLINIVSGLESNDLRNLVVASKACSLSNNTKFENEIIVSENEAIKTILEYERKSKDDIIDPMEIERYCQAFYQQGLKAEEVLKNRR